MNRNALLRFKQLTYYIEMKEKYLAIIEGSQPKHEDYVRKIESNLARF